MNHNENILDDGKAAIVDILQKCAGIPIALQRAGSWIAEAVRNGTTRTLGEVSVRGEFLLALLLEALWTDRTNG